MKSIISILLLLTLSLYSQTYRDTTNVIILTFSEPMRIWDLTVLDNYVVVNSLNDTIPVYATGYETSWVQQDSGLTKIGLLLPQLQWGVTYTFIVSNVRYLAGNVIDPSYQSVTYNIDNSTTKVSPPFIGFSKGISRNPLTIINAYAKDTSQVTTLPYRVFDGITYRGNINEIWASNPVPEWIVIELDQARAVRQIVLSFSYFHDSRIYSYSIDYTYFPSKVWYNAVPLAYSVANQEWVSQDVNFSCKYIRINFLTNNQSNWAGLYEIKILGE